MVEITESGQRGHDVEWVSSPTWYRRIVRLGWPRVCFDDGSLRGRGGEKGNRGAAIVVGRLRGAGTRREDPLARWEGALGEIRAEQEAIVAAGQWTVGSADLLSVIGHGRREVTHCRVLRWLCDPPAPHGLGTRFFAGCSPPCDRRFQRIGSPGPPRTSRSRGSGCGRTSW